MKTRRFIALGLLFSILTTGCGGSVTSREFQPAKSEPAERIQPAQDTQPAPARQGDRMDASAGSADVLAQKAQSYSQELAALMRARQAAPQLPPTPSQVQWTETPFPTGSDIRLSPEPSARTAAMVQPAVIPDISSSPISVNPDTQTNLPPTLPLARAPEARTEGTLRVAPVTIADASMKPSVPSVPAAPLGQDPLSLRVQSRLKDSPKDVWVQTEHQMLRLLRDEPTPEMQSLANLPQEDRELVTAIVDGLTNFRNAMRQDSNMLFSAKVRPIVEMAERLQSQAELTIPAIALCTKVDRFGVYEPIEPARFAAEREHPVIVYCEVANFMSSLNAAKLWQTQLQWDMTLYTEQAIPVWSDKTQVIEDAARSHRQDFFVRKMITLPRTLPVGRYLLKVTIVDKQSNRVAEATAPLVIGAQ